MPGRGACPIRTGYRTRGPRLAGRGWPSAHGSATVPDTTPITSQAYAMKKTHRKVLFQFVAVTALAGVSSLTLAADNIRIALARSEERRVGKECSSRGRGYDETER